MKFTSRRIYDFSTLGHVTIFIISTIPLILLILFVPFFRDIWESPGVGYYYKTGGPRRQPRLLFYPLFFAIRIIFFTPFRKKTITLQDDRIIHQKDEILYSDIKIKYYVNPFIVSKGAIFVSSKADEYAYFTIGSRYKNCWLIWEELLNRVKAANPGADIDPKIEQRISQLK